MDRHNAVQRRKKMKDWIINILLLLGLVPATLGGGYGGYQLALSINPEEIVVRIIAAIIGGFVGLVGTLVIYMMVDDSGIFK
jgi:RsiW-degrading membrane proteinase PrsW (M82 family)